MRKDDKRTLLVGIVLFALVVLSVIYNIIGQTWVKNQWDYLRRRYYYERAIKKKNLPMHPARFWRRENQNFAD
ncbi:MAG: hypothetical protein D6778_08400 [Nitrospirae bacterium]|nr:MAG: hypothetical protein D6778_08400 [Nitrospirota bacterium]